MALHARSAGVGRVGWLDTAVAVYGITIYIDAFFPMLRALGNQQAELGQADILSTLSQAVLLGILLILCWWRRDALRRILPDALPILVVTALCIVSVAWSEYPLASLRRSASFSTCILFGLYLTIAVGLDRTIRLIAYCVLAAGLASIASYFALPSLSRETDPSIAGALHGVFTQKNLCADAMLVGIIGWIYIMFVDRRRRLPAAIAIAIMFAVILMARSATATLVGLVSMVVGTYLAAPRGSATRLLIGWFGIAAAVVAAGGLAIDPTDTFGVIGRDPTLTGRIPLWHLVLQSALQRPWLGYGYGGFWNADSATVLYIWMVIEWQAPSAHCGYLDVLLQLGIVGLVFYGWVLGATVRGLWRARRSDPTPETAWIILFLVVNLILNIDEGPLPWPDIFGTLTPITLIYLAPWRRQRASPQRVMRAPAETRQQTAAL